MSAYVLHLNKRPKGTINLMFCHFLSMGNLEKFRKVVQINPLQKLQYMYMSSFKKTQANSENCGPPLGSKFDLEVCQRLPSRSQHGTTGKVLSQGTHMPSIKALSVIVQKLWPRLKFL